MGKQLPPAVCLAAGRAAGTVWPGIVWAGIAWAIGAIGTAAAQDNPMVGSWMTVDPGSGVHEVLTVTPDHITFGAAAPPIPYRFEQDGEALSVWLADGKEPARLVFFDDANAQLSVPGGPAIALRRQVATASAEAAEGAAAEPPAAQASAIEAAAAALLQSAAAAPEAAPPEETLHHPLDPSLESLLADGWQLDQINGSSDGVTLLMSHGGHHAICVLLPRETSTDTAASDCRRLN